MKVENSNALEDAELKYDFRIKVTAKRRGVAVGPLGQDRGDYVEDKRRIGVQFTVSTSGGGKKKKIQDAMTKIHDPRMTALVKKPVDDIVLIRLPFEAKEMYQQWVAAGWPSGGPGAYLSPAEKTTLLTKATHPYLPFSPEDLRAYVSNGQTWLDPQVPTDGQD